MSVSLLCAQLSASLYSLHSSISQWRFSEEICKDTSTDPEKRINCDHVQYSNSYGESYIDRQLRRREVNQTSFQDFEGQARAEKISRSIITVFGFVGLIFGAVIQQFSQTIYILAAGFALALIITIPPYPLYRKKPLNWQKSRSGTEVEGSTKKKQK